MLEFESKLMTVYPVTILDVVDGDTLHVEIDLGFRVSVKETIRMDDIDAPELNTPEGIASKAFLKQTLNTIGNKGTLTSRGQDKYGRWLALITIGTTELSKLMLDTKHAVYYTGGKR